MDRTTRIAVLGAGLGGLGGRAGGDSGDGGEGGSDGDGLPAGDPWDPGPSPEASTDAAAFDDAVARLRALAVLGAGTARCGGDGRSRVEV